MSEASIGITPRNILLTDQQISLVPTVIEDGPETQLAIVTNRNDPTNMKALEGIANAWATELQRQGHTCEVELGSNEVTCSTGLPMTELARMMPDLESRITRELGGGTDSGRAVSAGAGTGGGAGGYERDGLVESGVT